MFHPAFPIFTKAWRKEKSNAAFCCFKAPPLMSIKALFCFLTLNITHIKASLLFFFETYPLGTSCGLMLTSSQTCLDLLSLPQPVIRRSWVAETWHICAGGEHKVPNNGWQEVTGRDCCLLKRHAQAESNRKHHPRFCGAAQRIVQIKQEVGETFPFSHNIRWEPHEWRGRREESKDGKEADERRSY